jgi:hypothetical protein
MSGSNTQFARAGRQYIAIPDGYSQPLFHIYFRPDAETGRKAWFFTSGQQIFGPFGSFAEADEELSECRSAGRFLGSLDG